MRIVNSNGKIQLFPGKPGQCSLQIYSMNGRMVYNQTVKAEGSGIQVIDPGRNNIHGTYIIKVMSESGITYETIYAFQ